MAAHGVAEFPRQTLLGDRLRGDGTGARLVGILWLQTAVAYVVLAACLALRGAVPAAPTAAVLLISIILCLVEYPQTRTGLLIDLALVAGLSAFSQL